MLQVAGTSSGSNFQLLDEAAGTSSGGKPPPSDEAAGTSSGDNLQDGEESEWTRIGNLEEIITYPIDTGFGFTSERATVNRLGLTSKHFAQMTFHPHRLYHFKMWDRIFIPVRSNVATLFDTRLPEIRYTTLINELDMAWARIPNDTTFQRITYLGYPLGVLPLNTEATKYHISMSPDINIKLHCDFGFLSQTSRYNNFHGLVEEPDLMPNEYNNRYLGNFSTYTLINNRSLDALKAETNRYDLSRSNFRPNFVIDATTAYCEENISDLKIGSDVEFSNIYPCTHTFASVSRRRTANVDKLFEILQKNHSVNVRYPRSRASGWFPAFGINMNVKRTGKVYVGNEVYAKFHEADPSRIKLYSDYAN